MLNKEELYLVKGGAKFSASLLSAISKGITTILNLGQILGTSIRRIFKKNYC